MRNGSPGGKTFSQPRVCLTSVRSQVDPQNPYKKQGTAAHDCNIMSVMLSWDMVGDMGGRERRIPEVCWSFSLTYLAKLKANKRPCLKQMWQLFEE